MMDGAEDLATARFGAAAGAAGGGAAGAPSLGLLENMTACLDKSARISYDIGQPHLVMDVGVPFATLVPTRTRIDDK